MHTLALLKSVLSSEPGPQRPMAHSELAYLIKKKKAGCAKPMSDLVQFQICWIFLGVYQARAVFYGCDTASPTFMPPWG